MFKNIMVGVHSSEHSRDAQTLAFYLARSLHASVVGLHVVDILAFEGPLFNDIEAPANLESYLDTPWLRETLTARGHELLADFAAAAAREGVNAQTALDFGLIANQICERSKSADLVVLGYRGAQAALGGIAGSVARRASGTVLICPASAHELRRLVLAFDGSDRACKAMHAAAEMAAGLDAALTILTVSRDSKAAERRLAQARAYFEPYGVRAEFHHLTGHAAQEIVKFVRQQQSDALFIGAYGHSRLVEMMLGSTTEHVLHSSPCPVFLSR
jgi:nucleotide-binding universal stress UspA family protein